MEKHTDGVELVYARDRETWHRWLMKNQHRIQPVWLVYYKPASGKTRVSYNDAVDEAICFGWIDSKPNVLDAERSIPFFAPRKPKSNWSKVNKGRVERLLKENRMQPSGLRVVEQAKLNGTWNALDEVEHLTLPADLLKALQKDKKALKFFSAFPRSSKRNILEWIHNAKHPETRDRRVQETVTLAAKDIRANHYRQPNKTGRNS